MFNNFVKVPSHSLSRNLNKSARLQTLSNAFLKSTKQTETLSLR